MKHPNNLLKLRKAAGLTQEDIAKVWGVHRGDVSRIERGEHSITTAKREMLTKQWGWSASQILDMFPVSQIPVCGLVGEGGAVQTVPGVPIMIGKNLRDSSKDLSDCEHVEVPPGEYPVDMACVRVDGHNMHPVYKDGEILFYRRKEHTEEEFIGRDCIVELKDGRVMVRTVKASRNYGHYDLDSHNQPSVENVEIKSAAPIEWIKKG